MAKSPNCGYSENIKMINGQECNTIFTQLRGCMGTNIWELILYKEITQENLLFYKKLDVKKDLYKLEIV